MEGEGGRGRWKGREERKRRGKERGKERERKRGGGFNNFFRRIENSYLYRFDIRMFL